MNKISEKCFHYNIVAVSVAVNMLGSKSKKIMFDHYLVSNTAIGNLTRAGKMSWVKCNPQKSISLSASLKVSPIPSQIYNRNKHNQGILVAMASVKNFWRPEFWRKSGDGDHFTVKGCQKATF